MRAVRAAHAFDGERFLAGGATVLIDGDRIVDVQSSHEQLPADVEVVDYGGTVLPGLIDATPTWSRTHRSAGSSGRVR